jgi:predicted ATPase
LEARTASLDLRKGRTTVVNCGRGWYKWEHDKIQEAALLLVDTSKLLSVQFDVGQLLLEHLSTEDLVQSLFVVTNHLNTGAGSLSDDSPQRVEIASLNLRSGKAAFEMSTFVPAADYLDKGIALLAPSKWKDHNDITLVLYSTATEAHFCIGDFRKSKEYCDEVLGLDIPLLEQRRAYNALVLSLAAQAKITGAKDLCVEVLAKLGCKFPKSGRSFFIMAGVLRTTATIDKTTKKIYYLKPMQGEGNGWTLYLLDRLVAYSYQGKNPDLLTFAMLKGLRWTVKYGSGEVTAPILASVGLLLVIVGDFAGAKKVSELAMKHSSRNADARTRLVVYRHVIHYQIPTESCKKHLLEGYDTGVKSGDLESAFWCIYGFLDEQLQTAARLSSVLEDYASYNRQVDKCNNKLVGRSMRLAWQYATNLADRNGNKHILKGAVMDETVLRNEIERGKTDGLTR